MANQVNSVRSGAFAFEKLTVSNSSKALTSTVYDERSTGNSPNRYAQFATITTETDSIRYRTDGGAPTGTDGHLVTAGGTIQLNSPNDIKNFRAIRVTGDVTIQVSYAL